MTITKLDMLMVDIYQKGGIKIKNTSRKDIVSKRTFDS